MYLFKKFSIQNKTRDRRSRMKQTIAYFLINYCNIRNTLIGQSQTLSTAFVNYKTFHFFPIYLYFFFIKWKCKCVCREKRCEEVRSCDLIEAQLKFYYSGVADVHTHTKFNAVKALNLSYGHHISRNLVHIQVTHTIFIAVKYVCIPNISFYHENVNLSNLFYCIFQTAK